MVATVLSSPAAAKLKDALHGTVSCDISTGSLGWPAKHVLPLSYPFKNFSRVIVREVVGWVWPCGYIHMHVSLLHACLESARLCKPSSTLDRVQFVQSGLQDRYHAENVVLSCCCLICSLLPAQSLSLGSLGFGYPPHHPPFPEGGPNVLRPEQQSA